MRSVIIAAQRGSGFPERSDYRAVPVKLSWPPLEKYRIFFQGRPRAVLTFAAVWILSWSAMAGA